jgi:hypothetical protein
MGKNFKPISISILCAIFFSPLGAHASLFGNCDLSHKDELHLQSFEHCSQKRLDAFYSNLKSGSSIPDGDFNGGVQISKWPSIFSEIEESFLEKLWGGKVFYRDSSEEGILFNKIHVGSKVKLRFPAHVYFGKSLYDSKKSIIIDYSHNQDIEGYIPAIDGLVNENGFTIRDEIRKVHEELYLGRAYVRGKFLLNFILESAE